MKLHRLYEDDTKLSRKQMIDWCSDNIRDFSEFDSYTDREKYVIDVDAQVVYSQSSNVFVEINTQDTELLFEINCKTSFKITAPNLKSFKNFPNGNFKVFPDSFAFSNCGSLDFGDFYYAKRFMKVGFFNSIQTDLTNTKPQSLNKNQKWNEIMYGDNFVIIDSLDIINYTGLNEIHRLTLNPIEKIKNLSSIFDTKIKQLNLYFSDIYPFKEATKISKTVNQYIKLGKDHVMDMTLELADNGFEDEV